MVHGVYVVCWSDLWNHDQSAPPIAGVFLGARFSPAGIGRAAVCGRFSAEIDSEPANRPACRQTSARGPTLESEESNQVYSFTTRRLWLIDHDGARWEVLAYHRGEALAWLLGRTGRMTADQLGRVSIKLSPCRR